MGERMIKMIETKSKVSATMLVLLLALSALAFLAYVPQPAAAISGNCELGFQNYEGAGTATGIYGILSIHQVNYDIPAYTDQKVWDTLILKQSGGGTNLAEVNLVATHSWFWNSWSWEVHFTWKDGDTIDGTWNSVSGYFGQQIYVYCGESSGNTWVAQYSYNGGTWYNIGSGSHTYGSHWRGGNSQCGLETLYPASADQTVKITSTENVLVQSNNNWHYWTPSQKYSSGGDPSDYRIIDHIHVLAGWESQVTDGQKCTYRQTYGGWWDLNPVSPLTITMLVHNQCITIAQQVH